MRIGEFGPFYERALVKRKRVLAKGPPGTGKTFEFMRCARAVGYDYIGICSPTQSPVKIGGYPRPPLSEGGDATHALFDGIARAFRATKPTLLHFRDLGMANGETLKAIVDLVQFGTIDNRQLPEDVVIGADTNDVGQGAGVEGLIEPLKSRFHTIISIETNVEDVVQYGLARGWPPDLLAYLSNAPKAVHDWKPTKSIMNDGSCPRGWEYVAEWIRDGFDDLEVIGGAVGKGRAQQYLAFRKLASELPDVDDIIANPTTAPVPPNPSASWFVAMALASRMDGKTFGTILKYLQRMPQLFRAFAIRSAVKAEILKTSAGTLPKGYHPLHASIDFTSWSCTRDGQEVTSASGG
jgi:hypothetical protein